MIQIWIAMIYYLLLSFIKFQTKYAYNLHQLAQIIKELILDQISIIEILRHNYKKHNILKIENSQLAF